jgi:hypothetical protein
MAKLMTPSETMSEVVRRAANYPNWEHLSIRERLKIMEKIAGEIECEYGNHNWPDVGFEPVGCMRCGVKKP